VQPYKSGYRLGFFHSGNLKFFGPQLPAHHTFHSAVVMDFILTKIHNGNVMFFSCSPMNRAFTMIRKTTIDAIVDKFLK